MFCLVMGFVTTARGAGQPSYQVVTVEPGDTVWSIADGRYPNQDTRAKVEEIERANHLSNPIVQPGQQLRLPIDH